MTLDAVRSEIKTATRRHVETWRNLKAGDRLTLIEKGMGLPKGATQVVVCDVVVTNVRVEPLAEVTTAEVEREGLRRQALDAVDAGDAGSLVEWFIVFWLKGHGYPADADATKVMVRRIEWRYCRDEGAQKHGRHGSTDQLRPEFATT